MIAVWMLYCIAIGLAFVIAGQALEQGLRWAGRATRWAWIVALLGSYLVPVAAWLRPEAFASFPVPIADVSAPPATLPGTVAAPAAITIPAQSVTDWDGWLSWGWGLASLALLLTFGVAMVRLAALRRRWRTCTVDGRVVLVSRDVGPAVVGVWQPRVVLPDWALDLAPDQRELLLAHEEQHLRARDPWLLVAGVLAIMLAPWNVALWWQWRRLRLAVETDCDARVLAAGRSASAYGALLLDVGRRRSSQLVGAPAFGEPRSFLETRIRRMIARLPRWRWAGAGAAAVIAAGAVVGASQTPRPVVPNVAAQQPGVSSADVRALLTRYFGPDVGRLRDSAVIAWFVIDERGAVVAWGKSTLTAPIEVLRMPQFSYRVIPGYDTLRVAAQQLHAERDLLPTILVRLGDPSKMVRPALQPSLGRLDAIDRQTMQTRAERVLRLARQYHPEAFTSPQSNAAVALVMDMEDRVLGHAVGVRAPIDKSCLDVLTRLLPQFGNAQWLVSGCADGDAQHRLIVYWGTLLKR